MSREKTGKSALSSWNGICEIGPAFTDDVVKTNAVQILRQASIEDVKSL